MPPLEEPPTLDALLPPVHVSPVRGLTIAAEDRHGALHGVAGIVDKPLEQRRDPLWLDLAGAAGNVMVVGAPQTGKSNLLRTLVTSLALGNTPREAQFYCLDSAAAPWPRWPACRTSAGWPAGARWTRSAAPSPSCTG
ncbi:hypothetical protein TPA0907_00150 [Micromonospora humidisoli]|nr:FtsK/SpoIIIE domain-containing protein [Micromonospora sp. AKA109]GHJ05648.1 hypothetical protein TPA0907_00150 [Micromonospora sp. AKA109]